MKVEKAIKLAIENVRKVGLTDIFPRPYEVDLLDNPRFLSSISSETKKRINGNSLQSLKIQPIQHVLYPKKEPFDFRRAALMQPLDTITYLSLVLSVTDALEQCRPSLRSKRVFSYRFHANKGYLFNPNYHYTAFNAHVQETIKSSRVSVLVRCDISNFYDRINLHRLESTLLSLGLDKSRITLLNQLLLFWAQRDSYGIPIGGNASRILAEAALISVDDFLKSNDVRYSRFVDDFRFFAPDAKTAHAWLALLTERLYLEGLTINPSKTSIEDVSDRSRTAKPDDQKAAPVKEKSDGPTKMIVGYTGTIPTKFRNISEQERARLKAENLTATISKLRNKVIILPDEIKHLLRVIAAKSAFNKLSIAPELLARFPQFTPLIVDLAIKETSNLPPKAKKTLRDYFESLVLHPGYTPEYILIYSVRLLGSPGFESELTILNLFRNLRRNAGAYIGRAILDAILKNANRSQVLEIRQTFNRADAWEKRAIIRLVEKHLPEEEKRPWLKNVKVHLESDLFAVATIEMAKGTKKTKA